jgi:hypothetical protein
MYLVELKPGKEELYRTSDDLAIAIREGNVDARSRIYHRATAKWISITLHPQYKAIVAGEEDEAVPARKGWGLLQAGLSAIPVELSIPTENRDVAGGVRQRWKRPIGLGLASVLLLLGIQLAFSGPRPQWSGKGKPVALGTTRKQKAVRIERPAHTGRIEAEPTRLPQQPDRLDMISLASTTGGWPVLTTPDTISIPIPAVESTPALRLPRAPRLRSRALRSALATDAPVPSTGRSVQALLARYEGASDEAYDRLRTGIRVARLDRLFAPGRLTPGGGVPDTRLGLAGAANFIRVYRQQQAGIDQAYQDSVGLLAKRYRWSKKEVQLWYSRLPRKENPTLELLSGSLFAAIDSILGVLDAQAGAYKIRGTAIAFEDPAATQAYGALRRRIKEQIDAAVATGGATSFGPTGLLLQVIGTTTLPRET